MYTSRFNDFQHICDVYITFMGWASMDVSQRMNHTTFDLIKELEQEAGNFTVVALAVGFESITILVFSSDPNRQQKLDDAVIQGGEPIGFLGYDVDNKLLSVQTRAVAEHADEQWVWGYLNALTATFRTLLKQNHKVAELDDSGVA
jgi:hypothetical protein